MSNTKDKKENKPDIKELAHKNVTNKNILKHDLSNKYPNPKPLKIKTTGVLINTSI